MGNNGLLNFPGRPLSEANRANLNTVGEGFFETLRIPLLVGRMIDRRDIRPMRKQWWSMRFLQGGSSRTKNPLRRRFGLGPKDNHRCEIVGVVGNRSYNSLRSDAYPTVYEPNRPQGTIHFAIRTAMDSARLEKAVRTAVAAVDPNVSLTEFHTQTALMDRLLRTERLLGFVSGAFGLVALTLAVIGLGGLLAYTVARRLPCAYAIGMVLKTALFRLEPLDPWTAAVSLFTLLAVALLAAWVPARRAARIDPIAALREE